MSQKPTVFFCPEKKRRKGEGTQGYLKKEMQEDIYPQKRDKGKSKAGFQA